MKGIVAALFFALLASACGGGSSPGQSGTGGSPPPPPDTSQEWTWMSGSKTLPTSNTGCVGQAGIYGTQGVAASTNVPGGRQSAVSWTGSDGNLWLFGGGGCDSTGAYVGLNDLWEFNITSKTWTWVDGSNTGNVKGTYGTEGVAAPGNVPGSRLNATSSADSAGNFWLFGGGGQDSTGSGTNVVLNDLWKFSTATNEWTWVSGSSTAPTETAGMGQPGVYGIQGVPASTNVPGGRLNPVSWTDSNGNFWLFGGEGFDSAGTGGYLNDLWEFNPVADEWTWVSGSSTLPLQTTGTRGQAGIYGTQGVPSSGNVPGGRSQSISWIDGSGNLWLFGGGGLDSTGTVGQLNDLWEYNPASKTWTWVSGANTANAVGTYGTEGVASAANVPGGRQSAVSWKDTSGNFWLFGGSTAFSPQEFFNDLWEFNPTAKTWTWVSGADTPNQLGMYGTQGTPDATNVPGARWGAVSWADGSGNLWLFGGNSTSSTVNVNFNDLWRYQP